MDQCSSRMIKVASLCKCKYPIPTSIIQLKFDDFCIMDEKYWNLETMFRK